MHVYLLVTYNGYHNGTISTLLNSPNPLFFVMKIYEMTHT